MTTLINGLLSILQIFLILEITFGMSTFLFALGDDAMAEFIMGIQFLPTTIMMVHLCPKGSEGASYAMFTTVNNVSSGEAKRSEAKRAKVNTNATRCLSISFAAATVCTEFGVNAEHNASGGVGR